MSRAVFDVSMGELERMLNAERVAQAAEVERQAHDAAKGRAIAEEFLWMMKSNRMPPRTVFKRTQQHEEWKKGLRYRRTEMLTKNVYSILDQGWMLLDERNEDGGYGHTVFVIPGMGIANVTRTTVPTPGRTRTPGSEIWYENVLPPGMIGHAFGGTDGRSLIYAVPAHTQWNNSDSRFAALRYAEFEKLAATTREVLSGQAETGFSRYVS